MKKQVTRKSTISRIFANASNVTFYDDRNSQGVVCYDQGAAAMDYENYNGRVYDLGNGKYMVFLYKGSYYTLTATITE